MRKVLLSLFLTIFLVSCSSSDSGSGGNYLPVSGITGYSDHNFTEVGNNYFLLKTDGKLYSWGDYSSGYLGYNATSNQLNPKLIPALKDKLVSDFDEIQVGSNYVLYAITTDGKLYVWGNITNNFFGLDNGTIKEAKEVVIPNEIISYVNSYSDHAIISTKSGNVYFTGNNKGTINIEGSPKTIRIFSDFDNVVGEPQKIPDVKSSTYNNKNYVSLRSHGAYFSLSSYKEMYIWKEGENPKNILPENILQNDTRLIVFDKIRGDNFIVYNICDSNTDNYICPGIIRTYKYDLNTKEPTEINFDGKTINNLDYFLITNTDDKLYQINNQGNAKKILLGDDESVKQLDYYYVITTSDNYYVNETYRISHDKFTPQVFKQVNSEGDKVIKADDDFVITENGNLYYYDYSEMKFKDITPNDKKIKNGSNNIFQDVYNKIYYYDNSTLTELQGVENSNLVYNYGQYFNLENGSLYSITGSLYSITGSNTATKINGPLIKNINYGYFTGRDDKIYNVGTNNEYGKLGVGDTVDRTSLTEVKFE